MSRNALLAASYGRKDVGLLWTALSLLLKKCMPRKTIETDISRENVQPVKIVLESIRWGSHPLGNEYLRKMLDLFNDFVVKPS